MIAAHPVAAVLGQDGQQFVPPVIDWAVIASGKSLRAAVRESVMVCRRTAA